MRRGVLLGYIFSLLIPSEASGNRPSHTFEANRPYRHFQVCAPCDSVVKTLI
jgi:hypothetical protein